MCPSVTTFSMVLTWNQTVTQATDVDSTQTQTWPSVAAGTWPSPWSQVATQATQISMCVPGDSKAHKHLRGPRQQHRPGTQAVHINSDIGCSPDLDTTIVSRWHRILLTSVWSPGHHSPWTSIWIQATAQAVNMSLSDGMVINPDPGHSRAADPHMANSIMGHDGSFKEIQSRK